MSIGRFKVERFKPEHLYDIEPQDHQKKSHDHMLEQVDSGADLSEIERYGFTGLFGERPYVCSGFIHNWKWRGTAWSVIDRSTVGWMMVPIHRAVMNSINEHQPSVFKRLEMTVLEGFAPGRRWAELLGFTKDCVMEHYCEDGMDYGLYSRVRK